MPALDGFICTTSEVQDIIDAAVIAGAGAVAGNPTATAKDTAVNGVATTFMRSDSAPAVQKTSGSVFGLAKVDGTTITASAGVITAATQTPTLAQIKTIINALPTADPHVATNLWLNAGVLTVSAG